MAEEFRGGICGEAWWNSSKTMFAGCSSPCSTDMGSFGWTADAADIKAMSSYDEFKDNLLSSWELSKDDERSVSCKSILQGIDASQTQKGCSPRSYANPGEDSSITTFKPIDQDFSLEQQILISVTSSGNSTETCQFPMDSVSYGYGYPSTLLQTSFHSHPQTQSQQQSLFYDNRSTTSAAATYVTESSPSWPKLAPLLTSSLPKQQPNSCNNAPFWNASATGVNDVKACFYHHSCNLSFFYKHLKKKLIAPVLQTRLIQKKLGTRAIEYIKFLHGQVDALSTPYMKQAAAPTQQQQSSGGPEGTKRDLRSLGLCLVPVSGTFPVVNEATVDFWTPTFGGTFRYME
ncbi:hypothetical protein F3Y22_tig00110556pilonHSYRG00096 [Hibiscus syriacus]|uniref:Uncharacterized protein n=1 Tax=Hibiscus syriacus TaxID=106335 RepID=A0A6A3A938_HIBSY|nr:hypothetical protein F3Y22_tig00110556pilonHSYRG00096 [Hibiscus syriacus]